MNLGWRGCASKTSLAGDCLQTEILIRDGKLLKKGFDKSFQSLLLAELRQVRVRKIQQVGGPDKVVWWLQDSAGGVLQVPFGAIGEAQLLEHFRSLPAFDLEAAQRAATLGLENRPQWVWTT